VINGAQQIALQLHSNEFGYAQMFSPSFHARRGKNIYLPPWEKGNENLPVVGNERGK